MTEFNEIRGTRKIVDYLEDLDQSRWNKMKDKFSKKREKLEEFIHNLTEDNYQNLKKLAIESEGFLTIGLRKKLYDKLLFLGEAFVNKEEKYDFLFLDQQKSDIANNEFHFDKLLKSEDEMTQNSKFNDIIEKDCDRSIIYSVINDENHFDVRDDIVTETKKYIRTLTTINSGNYHYYQGYQDIGMYFFLLYVQNSFKSIAIFQRVTECFFKDYLNEKQDSYFPYNFILEIVEFLISNLDKALYKEMHRILDVVSPYWTTSWVLSWFSHNIKDIFLVYRIFDYLLVAHPLAIYYMSAVLTIEQLKLMFSKTEDSANIMSAIQKLNFESLDFDDIIFKTEKAMERFKTNNVVKKFQSRLPKNSFLRARNLNIFTFYKSAYITPVKVSTPLLNYFLISIIIVVFCIMANFYFKIPIFKH